MNLPAKIQYKMLNIHFYSVSRFSSLNCLKNVVPFELYDHTTKSMYNDWRIREDLAFFADSARDSAKSTLGAGRGQYSWLVFFCFILDNIKINSYICCSINKSETFHSKKKNIFIRSKKTQRCSGQRYLTLGISLWLEQFVFSKIHRELT